MTMGSSGTFDYVAIVPDSLEHSTSPWAAQLRKPLEHDNDPGLGYRLVGSSPNLQITDAGHAESEQITPPVPRSRLTLTASSRELSSVAAASFYVDKRLTSLLQPRDALHLSRTYCGGLGVSAIRDGELVFAAGASFGQVPTSTNFGG